MNLNNGWLESFGLRFKFESSMPKLMAEWDSIHPCSESPHYSPPHSVNLHHIKITKQIQGLPPYGSFSINNTQLLSTILTTLVPSWDNFRGWLHQYSYLQLFSAYIYILTEKLCAQICAHRMRSGALWDLIRMIRAVH